MEILCGLIVYKLVRRFFYDDDLLEVETSDSNALFSVANRYPPFSLLFLFLEKDNCISLKSKGIML